MTQHEYLVRAFTSVYQREACSRGLSTAFYAAMSDRPHGVKR